MQSTIHKLQGAVRHPDDWLVGMKFVGWDGKTHSHVVACNNHAFTEKQANRAAWDSMRIQGEYPPKLLNIKGVRAREVCKDNEHARGTAFLQKVKL